MQILYESCHIFPKVRPCNSCRPYMTIVDFFHYSSRAGSDILAAETYLLTSLMKGLRCFKINLISSGISGLIIYGTWFRLPRIIRTKYDFASSFSIPFSFLKLSSVDCIFQFGGSRKFVTSKLPGSADLLLLKIRNRMSTNLMNWEKTLVGTDTSFLTTRSSFRESSMNFLSFSKSLVSGISKDLFIFSCFWSLDIFLTLLLNLNLNTLWQTHNSLIFSNFIFFSSM